MTIVLAGTFHSAPAYAQIMRSGVVGFFDAGNKQCWSDPNGRSMVQTLDHARTLLMAWGMELGADITPATPEGAVATFTRYSIVKVSDSPPPPESKPVDEASMLREQMAEAMGRIDVLTRQCADYEARIEDLAQQATQLAGENAQLRNTLKGGRDISLKGKK